MNSLSVTVFIVILLLVNLMSGICAVYDKLENPIFVKLSTLLLAIIRDVDVTLF